MIRSHKITTPSRLGSVAAVLCAALSSFGCRASDESAKAGAKQLEGNDVALVDAVIIQSTRAAGAQDPHSPVDEEAIRQARQAPPAEALPQLFHQLGHCARGDSSHSRLVVDSLESILQAARWAPPNHEDVRAKLRTATHHPHKDVRLFAIQALNRMDGAGQLNEIKTALEDEDPEVRQIAAELLGALDDTRAAEPLTRVLNDRDPAVQRAAIHSLCRLKYRPAAPHLIEVLRQSSDHQVREAAVGTLQRLTGQSNLKADPQAWARWLRVHPTFFSPSSQ